ncbi:MAG: DUF2889 domain-containing protein [Myxococcota bacterium]
MGERRPYGSGCYRRRIELRASEGTARGELGDDFHHFIVEIAHDGRRVSDVRGEPRRIPWTTCPGALVPLQAMKGAEIAEPVLSLSRHTPSRAQCTHLHDLTCLTIAHAARALRGGARERRYDVTIPDRIDRRADCRVDVDGMPVLHWSLRGLRIVGGSDGRFDDLSIGSKPFREALGGLDGPDAIEAAWVLQRAVFIGLGRQHDFDAMETAREFAGEVGGGCHAFAPERLDQGLRILGNAYDFSSGPEAILLQTPNAPGALDRRR